MKRLALLPVALLIVAVAVLQAQPPVPRPNPDNPPNPAPNVNPPNSPPQTPPSTNPLQPSAQPNAAVNLQVRRSKQLIGSRVSLNGGASAGIVDDIVFTDEGCIDYLVVVNQGRYVPVPWQAAKFDYTQRIATVNITPERFREVPVFTTTNWPNFYEPSYMTRVYGYYGIALPERHRHIDRRP